MSQTYYVVPNVLKEKAGSNMRNLETNSKLMIYGEILTSFLQSFIGEKIIDLPVRYYERVQGESKMGKRFFNFLNMMKVCLRVFKCFKLKNKLV